LSTRKRIRGEWRSGQVERRAVDRDRRAADAERRALAEARDAERRDHEISQARLVIVEPINDSVATWGGPTQPNLAKADVVVHNYSSEPVFHLHVEEDPNNDVVVFNTSPAVQADPSICRFLLLTAVPDRCE
jgi:hypothetical protein